MIDELTEKRFRELALSPLSSACLKLWGKILDDIDIKSALAKLLFVPSTDPDERQNLILMDVLNALTGQPHRLTFHNDLLTTDAKIIRSELAWKNDEPCFGVGYIYMANGGTSAQQKIEVHHTFRYPRECVSFSSWNLDRLECHWRVGKRITCRYKQNSPREHAIESPFGWRVPPQSAHIQPRSLR